MSKNQRQVLSQSISRPILYILHSISVRSCHLYKSSLLIARHLDPSVYPHFDIYNSTSIAEEECVVISALSEPLFELVRLVPGYPIFDLCK